MTRYAVISADGHAGPPAEVYRDYLDPGFRERFDEHQRAMEELRAAMGRSDAVRVPTRVGGGDRRRRRPHRRLRLGRAQRGARRGRRRRRGAVPRCRRARHRTHRVVAVRHRARRRVRQRRGGDRGQPRPQPLAGRLRAPRSRIAASGRGDPAIIPDMDTVLGAGPRGEGARPPRHPHPDALVRPARVPRPVVRAVVDAHRGARPRAAHAFRRGAERHRSRPGDAADLRHRGLLVGGAPALGADLGRRLRAPPGPRSTRWPRTGRGGCRTRSARWTRSGSAATTPASSATRSARRSR